MSVTIGAGQTSSFSNAPPDGDDADAAAFAALVAQQPPQPQQPTRDGPDSGGDTAGQVNSFYQDLLGQNADPRAMADIQDAMAAGQSLTQVETNLRFSLAHSDVAAAKINSFYRDVLGQDADPTSLANIENALTAGQSMAQMEAALRPQFARSDMGAAGVQSLYQEVVGRAADGTELANAQAALAAC